MGALQLNLLSSPRLLFPPVAMNLVNFLKGRNMAPFKTGGSLTITSSNIPLHVPQSCSFTDSSQLLACSGCLGGTHHYCGVPKRGGRPALLALAGQQQPRFPLRVHSSKDKNNSFWKWKRPKPEKKKAWVKPGNGKVGEE